MPVDRRSTPPTSQIKEHKSVLTSLSAWTDTGEDEVGKVNKRGRLGYRELVEHDLKDTATCKEKVRFVLDPDGDHFNMVVGLVIISNALVIGAETEFGTEHFEVFEHLFNSVFFFEMTIRIHNLGCAYFSDSWNLFDFTLVCTGTLDLWILPLFTMGSASRVLYHFSVMRMLRILRLLRVLRVVRLFRMFQHLHLIMQAFNKAFQIVLLMGLLVLIIDYVVAIMLTQGVGKQKQWWPHEDQKSIEQWFGSIPNSMQTLFMIMTLTGWNAVSNTLVKVLPEWIVYTGLVLYIMVTSYTMLSLITGIISESLITSQQEYRLRKEKTFDEKRKELSFDLRQNLYSLHEDEKDEHGTVETEALKTTMKGDTDTLMRLAAININIDEPGVLSLIEKLVEPGTGRVNLDYFVDKLVHLNGMASASTMMDLKYDLSKMQQKIQLMATKMGIAVARPPPCAIAKVVSEPSSPASNEVVQRHSTSTMRSSLRASGSSPHGQGVMTQPSHRNQEAKTRFQEAAPE